MVADQAAEELRDAGLGLHLRRGDQVRGERMAQRDQFRCPLRRLNPRDLRDGQWHFIVATVDRCTNNGSLATLYVDGAPAGTSVGVVEGAAAVSASSGAPMIPPTS